MYKMYIKLLFNFSLIKKKISVFQNYNKVYYMNNSNESYQKINHIYLVSLK